jgi:uncharacterized protein (TIRG00374 family)
LKANQSGHKISIFNIRLLIGILISFAGLYLGFRKFNAREFIISLKHADLRLFLISMLLMVFVIFLRAWRWQYLVKPIQSIRMSRLFAATTICYFGNNVFPFRIGELLRCYSLNKISGISSVSAFGTVVIERMIDVTSFLLIMLVSFLFIQNVPEWMRWGIKGAAIILISLSALLVILNLKKVRLSEFLIKRFRSFARGKLSQLLEKLFDGLSTLRKMPHLSLVLAQTVIIWIFTILNLWVIGTVLHYRFSLEDTLLIFFVTSAIVSVPSAPGYVGTYHAGAIGILLYLGMTRPEAQALAVILHATGFLSLTLLGLVYFLRYHVSVPPAGISLND